MESGFIYFLDNPDLFNLLKTDFYSNPELAHENRGKQNLERHMGTLNKYNFSGLEKDFWENHIELFEYLNEFTYPRDPEYYICSSWIKHYIEGSFSGLHAESQDWGMGRDQHTNVILIDQAEDIIGGMNVIAGDSYQLNKDPNSKGNLRERLLTRFLEKPGDAIVWDANAVHGVSKIEKGYRLVLVCIKIKMER